jgi:CRP-like cAMP-binding protein
MPTSFDVADLSIPQASEIHALIERLPNIETLQFQDGEYLIRQDEAITDTFIVVFGSYAVEHTSAGPEKRPLKTLAAVSSDVEFPSFVGEMAYLGGGFRTASVRSSGSTFALKLKEQHMDVIIAEFPSFTSILCRQFTARLREANKALENTSMETKMIMKTAGELVVRRGEKAKTLYQLVTGSLVREDDVEVIYSDQEHFGFVDPGPFFRDGEYESTVKTETPCSLVAISKKSKLAVIRNFPELILKLYEEEARGRISFVDCSDEVN